MYTSKIVDLEYSLGSGKLCQLTNFTKGSLSLLWHWKSKYLIIMWLYSLSLIFKLRLSSESFAHGFCSKWNSEEGRALFDLVETKVWEVSGNDPTGPGNVEKNPWNTVRQNLKIILLSFKKITYESNMLTGLFFISRWFLLSFINPLKVLVFFLSSTILTENLLLAGLWARCRENSCENKQYSELKELPG